MDREFPADNHSLWPAGAGPGTGPPRPSSLLRPALLCCSVLFGAALRLHLRSPLLCCCRLPASPCCSVSLAVTVYCLAREIAEYVRVLRIGRKTLEELATEFPHDIGKMLNDMALKGRRNMARMRWRMVWGKVH